MTEEASGQPVEESNVPETTEAVTEGMTDAKAWEVVDGMTEQGTGDAPGNNSGDTLNLTQEQFTERLNRKEESTRTQLLERYKQKYAGIESLDDLDDILEAYGAAEDEERTQIENMERQVGEKDTSIESLASERNDYKGKYESALKLNAVQQALVSSGIRPDRVQRGLANVDTSKLELDEKGAVSGVEEAVKALKDDVSEWFTSNEETQRPGIPIAPNGSGSTGVSYEERMKKSNLNGMRL